MRVQFGDDRPVDLLVYLHCGLRLSAIETLLEQLESLLNTEQAEGVAADINRSGLKEEMTKRASALRRRHSGLKPEDSEPVLALDKEVEQLSRLFGNCLKNSMQFVPREESPFSNGWRRVFLDVLRIVPSIR